MRILVVEDAEKLARALETGLEAEGYAVDVLYDGAAARRRFAARRGAPGRRWRRTQLPYDLPDPRRHAARRRRLHALSASCASRA